MEKPCVTFEHSKTPPVVIAMEASELNSLLDCQGLGLSDGVVTWATNCPQHPRNWPIRQKAYNAGLVILLDFFITALGTVGTSSSKFAHVEYNIRDTVSYLGFTSMFFFGQVLGALIFPSYSESFGRKNLYLVSTFVLAVSSIVIPVVNSVVAAFVCRFFSGFAAAIPSTIAPGTIEDLFDEQSRMWLISIWLIIANLALAVGPIFASYVANSIGWRWIFYVSTILASGFFVLFIVTKESRPTQLLQQRLQALKKAAGDSAVKMQVHNPDRVPNFRHLLHSVLFRPLRLLLFESIVLMTSVISSLAFALIFLFAEALPIVYGSFGFSDQGTSLAFIPIGVGMLCTIFTRVYDQSLTRRFIRQERTLLPEDKLVGFAIASPAFAIGLWCFAWTVPPAVRTVPWIVSMLALIPVGFAINEFDCVIVGYLTDSYTTYAASAYSALCLLRFVFSAVFPLFGSIMYAKLGANTATTILATIATVACASPFILIRFGRRLRQASKFARNSVALKNDATQREDYEGARAEGVVVTGPCSGEV